MKVVHLCHLPLPPGHPDHGRLVRHPGRWVLNLVMAQRFCAGIDARLVVQVAGGSCDHRTEMDGVPVHFVAAPSRFRAMTLFYFDARRLARAALAMAPDVIHAHGTEEAHLLAAQATGKPYVVTAQGMLSQINAVMPPRMISRQRVVEFLERRSLAKARHIIAKSDYVADWIRSQYPQLTVHRIPNTFDPALLDIPCTQPRQPRSIGFLGVVEPRKGLDSLADALEILEGSKTDVRVRCDSPDSETAVHRKPGKLTLHIVGNCGDGGTDYERAILTRLRQILGSRLVLHGILPGVEAARVVAQCELLAAPSIEEMFGNQVIEALLVGTWPIVSSRTAMEENVKRVGAGTVFENGNATDLARSISPAFANQQTWDRQATRKSVVDWIGPEAISVAHLHLYRAILGELCEAATS